MMVGSVKALPPRSPQGGLMPGSDGMPNGNKIRNRCRPHLSDTCTVV